MPWQQPDPPAVQRTAHAGGCARVGRRTILGPWAAAVLTSVGIAVCSRAAAQPVPGDPPPDYAALSAADRLGIAFDPLAKPGEGPFLATRAPDTILLPRFVVEDVRVRLTDRDALTGTATLKLAEDAYLSPLYRVAFGPLMQVAAYYFNPLAILRGWHPNEAEALVLYRQDERLRGLAELDSLIGLELLDDAKDAGEFQRIRFDAGVSTR
jgi:hypothetical protein